MVFGDTNHVTFIMEAQRITLVLAILFLHMTRRVVTGQDDSMNNEEQSSIVSNSVELSFWVALGLASSVIVTCLCCIFCCKARTLLPPNSPTTTPNLDRGQTREGRDNDGMEYSDPPPPYTDALKYELSKDDEGPPQYSEAYL